MLQAGKEQDSTGGLLNILHHLTMKTMSRVLKRAAHTPPPALLQPDIFMVCLFVSLFSAFLGSSGGGREMLLLGLLYSRCPAGPGA